MNVVRTEEGTLFPSTENKYVGEVSTLLMIVIADLERSSEVVSMIASWLLIPLNVP